MKIQDITKLQEANGVSELQELINTGTAWKLEGSVGRAAMDALRSGACMLPETAHRYYWGNRIPSRHEVKEGTQGSLQNCISYWEGVEV